MSIGWQGNIDSAGQVFIKSLTSFRVEKLNGFLQIVPKIVSCLCDYCGGAPASIDL